MKIFTKSSSFNTSQEQTFGNLLEVAHNFYSLANQEVQSVLDLINFEDSAGSSVNAILGITTLVLNKIDLLEADEEPIVQSVDRLIRMTAQQLEIPRSHVLRISAKHGLKAGVTGDTVRHRRSGFAHLEQHLVKSVIETRERLLQDDVLAPLVVDVKNDMQRLQDEQHMLKGEQAQFESNQASINTDYTRAQRVMSEDRTSFVQREKSFNQGKIYNQ